MTHFFFYHTGVLHISLNNREIKPEDNFPSDVQKPYQCKSSKFYNIAARVNRVRAFSIRKQKINSFWHLGFPQVQKHRSLTFITINMACLSERQGVFLDCY